MLTLVSFRSHSAQRGSLMMKRYLEQVIDHGSEDLRNAFGGAFCKRWKAKNEASDAPVKFTVFRVWYSKGIWLFMFGCVFVFEKIE